MQPSQFQIIVSAYDKLNKKTIFSYISSNQEIFQLNKYAYFRNTTQKAEDTVSC